MTSRSQLLRYLCDLEVTTDVTCNCSSVIVDVTLRPAGSFYGGKTARSCVCPYCGLPGLRIGRVYAHSIEFDLDAENEPVCTYGSLCAKPAVTSGGSLPPESA